MTKVSGFPMSPEAVRFSLIIDITSRRREDRNSRGDIEAYRFCSASQIEAMADQGRVRPHIRRDFTGDSTGRCVTDGGARRESEVMHIP